MNLNKAAGLFKHIWPYATTRHERARGITNLAQKLILHSIHNYFPKDDQMCKNNILIIFWSHKCKDIMHHSL